MQAHLPRGFQLLGRLAFFFLQADNVRLRFCTELAICQFFLQPFMILLRWENVVVLVIAIHSLEHIDHTRPVRAWHNDLFITGFDCCLYLLAPYAAM